MKNGLFHQNRYSCFCFLHKNSCIFGLNRPILMKKTIFSSKKISYRIHYDNAWIADVRWKYGCAFLGGHPVCKRLILSPNLSPSMSWVTMDLILRLISDLPPFMPFTSKKLFWNWALKVFVSHSFKGTDRKWTMVSLKIVCHLKISLENCMALRNLHKKGRPFLNPFS
jgi:hypothetical protein